MTALIDTYCEVWNESDLLIRAERLAEVWALDATYTDPMVHAISSSELLRHIDNMREILPPDVKIIRTSCIDEHHKLIRFSWQIVQSEGAVFSDGVDFVEISNEGKIQRIIGFIGAD
ncbi:MAG: hypothetical protein RLZ75_1813 [Pseudomonadota bacterium]|jgi:hypothetical protein